MPVYIGDAGEKLRVGPMNIEKVWGVIGKTVVKLLCDTEGYYREAPQRASAVTNEGGCGPGYSPFYKIIEVVGYGGPRVRGPFRWKLYALFIFRFKRAIVSRISCERSAIPSAIYVHTPIMAPVAHATNGGASNGVHAVTAKIIPKVPSTA